MRDRIKVRTGNGPDAGRDFRVFAEDCAWERYPMNTFVRKEPSPYPAHVEVQAFRSDVGNPVNVSLVIDTKIGMADIRLSPEEARLVADSLLTAANEADDIWRGGYVR